MSTTRSAQHRQKLIEAAIEVMKEAGLEAATTRRVAEQAGVSGATVHYVFDGKDELLVSAIDELAERSKSVLRSALQENVGEARIEMALPALLRHYWDFVVSDTPYQLMQFELTVHCLRKPELQWLAQRQLDAYRVFVEESLAAALAERGAADGIDTAAAARLIIASLDGIVLQFLTHRDDQLAHRDLENLGTMLLSFFRESTAGSATGKARRDAPRTGGIG